MKAFDKFERRQILFDVVVAAIILTLGLVGQVEIEALSDVYLRESDWLHIILVILMSAPLALRRIFPAAVFGIVLGSWVVDRALDYPESLAAVGVFVAFYTIGTAAGVGKPSPVSLP